MMGETFFVLAKRVSRKTKFVVLASLVDFLERLLGNTKKKRLTGGWLAAPPHCGRFSPSSLS